MKNFLPSCAVLAGVFLFGLGGCGRVPKETSAPETGGPADLAKIHTEIQALETDFGQVTTNQDLDALQEYYATMQSP